MNVQLDRTLIYRTKRRARDDGLTQDERVAINLLWRRGIKVPILTRVFKVGKNTIYYKALTGEADSYPNSPRSNSARDTNDLIEELGEKAAWAKFVTDEMIQACNEELAKELEQMRLAR
jgi:hypothetical protein